MMKAVQCRLGGGYKRCDCAPPVSIAFPPPRAAVFHHISMKKLSIVFVAVLLLALHLTSQVADADGGSHSQNVTATAKPTGSASGSPAAFTLLVAPLLLSTVLLHGWSG